MSSKAIWKTPVIILELDEPDEIALSLEYIP